MKYYGYQVRCAKELDCTDAVPTDLALTANPPAICPGEAVTLTASANGAASYSLNGINWQTATTFSVAPANDTSYTLYIRTAVGCTATLEKAATVTVYPALSPGSIIGGSTTTVVNVNPNVTIGSSAAASGGSGSFTYQWRRNNVEISNSDMDAYTLQDADYNTVGTYYFNRYTKDNGCNTAWAAAQGTFTLVVDINCTDALTDLALTADPTTVCAGETVTLTASANGASSYSLNGTNWQTSSTFSVVANASYTLYVKTAAGCTATAVDAATVTVNTPPAAPTDLTSNVPAIYEDTSTTMTLTATGGSAGSGAVYEWGTGSVIGNNPLSPATTTGNTYSVAPAAATTYWVRLRGVGACSATITGGVTLAIEVSPVPCDEFEGYTGDFEITYKDGSSEIIAASEINTHTSTEIVKSITLIDYFDKTYLIGRVINAANPISLKFDCDDGNLVLRDAVDGYIPIGSYAEFQLISGNGTNKKYRQEIDLDLLGVEWTPIANNSGTFSGEFDGAGKTLSNLKIDKSGQDYQGLFHRNAGTIRDVHIASGTITAGGNSGCVCGENSSGGQVISCTNAVTVVGSDDNVGGVVGWNFGAVTACYNTGAVSGNNDVGGVVGYNYDGTVTACYNTGAVSGTYYAVGGVVGMNYAGVTACYNTGAVSGNNIVGGVVGFNYEGTVTACYNTGAVSGNNLVGNSLVGGVVGYNDSAVTACYWESTTSIYGIGSGSGEVTPFTLSNYFIPTGSPAWGTGNGGENGWWKAGTTDGTQLPRLWWEQDAAGCTVTFLPGSITAGATTTVVNVNPNVTIESSTAASSGSGSFTYQWRRTGTSSDTLTGNNATYTLSSDASNYSNIGTYYFNRYAKDNGCNTAWAAAQGTFTLVVTASLGTAQPQGGCAYTELDAWGTFEDFPENYSASTYVSLTDARDGKNYPVVQIGGRWVMARNLNYQTGLTWQENAAEPSTATGSNPALIGHFWCPGDNEVATSSSYSCEVWGALYAWETAMMVDGKWTSSAQNSSAWSQPVNYGTSGSSGNPQNHARSDGGDVTDGRGICPPNWHIPSDEEWGELLNAMESGAGTTHNTGTNERGADAGKRGKAACNVQDLGTSGNTYVNDMQANWYYYSSTAGTDVYGFRVLPAGYRQHAGSTVRERGYSAYFWSSTAYDVSSAWIRAFFANSSRVLRDYYNDYRSYGQSVRCIRDTVVSENTDCADAFSPGAITSGSATTMVSVNPEVTIGSASAAAGGSGNIIYQWRRTGTSSATLTGSNATYTLGSDASNYSNMGTYYFNRYAQAVGCSSAWAAAQGTYTLVVTASLGTAQPQGGCAYTELDAWGTFENFPSTYSAATYVSLTDARDGKNYPVVQIGGRWVMARNLNYQTGLTWQTRADQPSTVTGSDPALIGHFWCPGGYTSVAPYPTVIVPTSTLESCNVWGALYAWETAMMVDGKWTSSAQNSSAWSEVVGYGVSTGSGNPQNHARSDGGGVGGRGICPPNWHIPSDEEWGDLLNAMESESGTPTHNYDITMLGADAGRRGKAACIVPDHSSSGNAYVDDVQANWYYYDDSAVGTDVYGFRALPAGYRDSRETLVGFIARGNSIWFWTSTAYNASEVWSRWFAYGSAQAGRYYYPRSLGSSVRCIRDAVVSESTAAGGYSRSLTAVAGNSGTSSRSLMAVAGGSGMATATGAFTAGAVGTMDMMDTGTTGTGFASTTTWNYGGSIWSDRVTHAPAACREVTASLSTTDSPSPPAEFKTNRDTNVTPNVDRYYYNWTCAQAVCPAGWSLPARAQFDALGDAVRLADLITNWGLGGYAKDSRILDVNGSGLYWSSTNDNSDTNYAHSLYYINTGWDTKSDPKINGFQVRCVKDPDCTEAPLAAPSVTAGARCGSGTVTLSATAPAGAVVDWYTDPSGERILSRATNDFTTSISTSETYYARSRDTTTGCMSDLIAVLATVNPQPTVISSTGASRCDAGTVILKAEPLAGAVIDWYGAATGGSALAGGSATENFTTPVISSSTVYYAQARDITTGCVSASRTAVTATVNALPNAPDSPSANSRCGAGTVTFSATAPEGCTIDWYDTPTGGNVLRGGYGVIAFSPDIEASTTCYAQLRHIAAGCASKSRTAVTAVVYPLPADAIVTAGSRCGSGTVTLKAEPPAGVVIDWYGAATGGTVLAGGSATDSFTTPVISSSTTYYAEARDITTGCASLSRTAVLATVHPVPIISRSGGAAVQSLPLSVAITAMTYTAPDATISMTGSFPPGVTGTASGASYIISGTPTATGTFGYTLTAAAGGCTGTAVAGTLTVRTEVMGFYTSSIWNYDGYIWSDRVVGTPAGCSGVPTLSVTDSPLPPAEFKISDISGVERYYYNWTCAQSVCPSGWILPTRAQFNALLEIADFTNLAANWGLGGHASGSDMFDVNTSGLYWSSTEDNSNTNYAYPFFYSHYVLTTNSVPKNYGFQVRCVKDIDCAEGIPATLTLTADPAAICAGTPVKLIASASGGTQYSIDGANWQTSPVFSVSPTANTSYALWVMTDAGCAAKLENAAAVTVHPLPMVASSAGAARCGSGTVTLHATTPSAVIDWYNAASAGTVLASGNTYTTPSLTVTTTYYAEARNTSTGCVSSSRTAVSARVNPLPTNLAFTASPATICAGATVTLTASATVGNGAQYRLNGTDWQPATTFSVSPAANTSYTLYVRTAAGCTASTVSAASVTVHPQPAVASFAGASRCGAGTLTLSATPSAGAVINWYDSPTGDSVLAGGSATDSFTTPVISSTVFYYAEARNTTTGCVSRRAVTATVLPLPADLTLTADPATICAEEMTTLMASASGTASYSIDGTNWQTEAEFYVSPPADTAYTLWAMTDEGCSATLENAAAVTVNPLPINLALTASPATICAGETVKLTALATNGVQYRLAGTSWQASPVFSVSPAANTSYTLWAATNKNCVTALENAAVVKVNPLPAISRSGGAAGQRVDLDVAIAAMIYTASDAGIISITGNLPSGVTGTTSGAAYIISGAPTATGTFAYMLTAAAAGCTGMAVADTLTVFTGTGFYSPATWNYSGSIWSDRVTGSLAACRETAILSVTASPAPPPQFKMNKDSGVERYYYNWTCAQAVCPSGWLLPTGTQLTALRGAADAADLAKAWGLGGFAYDSIMRGADRYTYYWSSTEDGSNNNYNAYSLYYGNGDLNMSNDPKYYGFQIRCVKDCAPTGLTFSASPATVCAGTPVKLIASTANGVQYSIDGMNWQASPAFDVTPAANTSYTLWTMTDEGCVATLEHAAAVTVHSVPGVIKAAGESRCGAGTVTLTAIPSEGAVIDWYDQPSGGTSFTANDGVYIVDVTSSAIYYAQARIAATGCVSDSRAAAAVTVNPLPSGVSFAGATRCGEGTVTLTTMHPIGILIDWYDVPSGGSVCSGGLATDSFTTPNISSSTTYYAQARDRTTGCAPALRTAVLAVVHPLPVVLSVTSPAVCYGEAAQLSAELGIGTTSAMTCTWNVGRTVITSSASTITTSALTATTIYTVQLMNAYGCVGEASAVGTITVHPRFTAGTISSTGQTLCAGSTPTVIGNTTAASGGSGAISYQWYKGATAITGATAATYTPPASDATVATAITYTRRAAAALCGTQAVSAGSWVLNVVAAPTVTATGAETLCYGTVPAVMTATVSGETGTPGYQWYRNGVTLGVGAQASTYSPGALTATATYSVVVTQTGNGCSATSAPIVKTVYNNAMSYIAGSSAHTATESVPMNNVVISVGDPVHMTITHDTLAGISVNFSNSSGMVTISGSPSTYGSMTYSLSAPAMYGCTAKSLSGTITVKMGLPNNTVGTWTCGNSPYLYSTPVRVSGCNSTNYTISTTEVYCRNYTSGGVTSYYYNAMFVEWNNMCSGNWHKLTQAEADAIKNNCTYATAKSNIGLRGWVDDSGTPHNYGSRGYAWIVSDPSGDATVTSLLKLKDSKIITNESAGLQSDGHQVICARDK
jgi:uncharacterized protein (TIGR02145 family)